MPGGHPVVIDYSAFCLCSPAPGGKKLIEGNFGSVSISVRKLSFCTITSLTARLQQEVQLLIGTPHEGCALSTCLVTGGQVRLASSCVNQTLTIPRGTHSFVYASGAFEHHYSQCNDEPLSVLHVAFDIDYYRELLTSDDEWCSSLKQTISSDAGLGGVVLPLSPLMFRVVQEIMHSPISGPLGDALFEPKVLELLIYQLHQYSNLAIYNSRVESNDRRLFLEIREYLASSLDKEHSLRALCKRFAINECKLKKGFKDAFGETVFGYLHALKMERARELMENAGFTVSQTATRTGYKNPNHFSAAFKKQFGVSPAAIRRRTIMPA